MTWLVSNGFGGLAPDFQRSREILRVGYPLETSDAKWEKTSTALILEPRPLYEIVATLASIGAMEL
jgi:hypothetical protein